MTNTLSTLNGFFKEVYAGELEDLIPKGLHLQRDIQFIEREKMPGNNFNQPVVLQQEHGVTYNAAGDGSGFALNGAIAGQTQNAQVKGAEMVIRSRMSYAAASDASSGGPRAFVEGTKFLVQNTVSSVRKRLEISLFWGQDELGVVSGTPAADVVTISTAEWAPGVWVGLKGAELEVFDSAGTTKRTGTGSDGQYVVQSVDLDGRTVTVDDDQNIADTDRIFFRSARTTSADNDAAGLHKILTNTGSLFGINAGTYDLWKANSYSAGSAALSFPKIQKAMARAVEKGLEEDAVCYCHPGAWADMMNDQDSLRQFDGSYEVLRGEQGSQAIRFHSQSGMIDIKPTIYQKEGYSHIISPEMFKRVGSADVSFDLPDGGGEEFFMRIENAAAFELRGYSNQSLFTHAPGQAVVITDIENETA